MNAHKLTNAARAAVYVLSTRTGARRPRIGRRLSVDDRRFDGASAYRYIPSHGQRRSKVPCQLSPWSAIAAVAMKIGARGLPSAAQVAGVRDGSRPLRIRCEPRTSVRAREHLVVVACPTARRAVV